MKREKSGGKDAKMIREEHKTERAETERAKSLRNREQRRKSQIDTAFNKEIERERERERASKEGTLRVCI